MNIRDQYVTAMSAARLGLTRWRHAIAYLDGSEGCYLSPEGEIMTPAEVRELLGLDDGECIDCALCLPDIHSATRDARSARGDWGYDWRNV